MTRIWLTGASPLVTGLASKLMNSTIRNTSIEVVQGDITNQPDIQVIVNAANAELRTGGGVAGAIHRAAGPSLEKECRQYAPIKPGEAVITSGYNLPNSHVIHCLGPRYGIDEPSDQLLARCYPRALGLAKEHGLVSIAFPAISTGAFGYPLREAARIAVQTVIDWVSEDQAISAIRFVLFDRDALTIYEEILGDLAAT